MVASFTAKTENLEKTIYFLSLMSCPINKLKSHMLLHVKILFAPGGGGAGGGAGVPSAPFLYSPALCNYAVLMFYKVF